MNCQACALQPSGCFVRFAVFYGRAEVLDEKLLGRKKDNEVGTAQLGEAGRLGLAQDNCPEVLGAAAGPGKVRSAQGGVIHGPGAKRRLVCSVRATSGAISF